MRSSYLMAMTAGFAMTSAALAQNGGVQLTDGNASYDITSTGASGTIPTTTEPGGTATGIQANFRVGGSTVDNSYSNWWWYRVNGVSTRELGIRQTTGTAVRTMTGTNSVNYAITTGGLQFDLSFTLTALSTTAANIYSSVRVTNNTGAPADISLFNMMDLFLAGQDANDRVLSAGVTGGDRAINFDDSVLTAFKAQHRGFGASGFGVGTFSAVSSQITDTGIDNFADLNAFVSPDDLTSVMQFNLGTIAAGGTGFAGAAYAVDIGGNAVNAIPAPGALALLGMGGLLAARRRR